MEHIRMPFTATNYEFVTTGTKTLSCRIDRYAQMLHDTYLSITLPDIWSPLKFVGSTLPAGYTTGFGGNSVGYEFQWIPNIGYNLIDHVDLVMNGQVIQRLRGEWLKMYSYLLHDANKRKIIDEMVGNVPACTILRMPTTGRTSIPMRLRRPVFLEPTPRPACPSRAFAPAS